MKKFLSFSKLLSRRILIVTFFTTIIVALCVVAFVTKGVIRMTDAYFQGQVKACNESVSKLLGHVDQDSFYQYMRRIDGEINKTFSNEDAIGEDYQNMRAYCLVLDSVGNFIYHPDRQRIGQSWRPVLGLRQNQAPVPMTTPQEVFIEPQSTILFYTDGLNEAMDADNNEFGDDRILDEVNRAIETGQLSPKALIDRMTQAVHEFVGDAEQSDDLTMLVVQYHKHD